MLRFLKAISATLLCVAIIAGGRGGEAPAAAARVVSSVDEAAKSSAEPTPAAQTPNVGAKGAILIDASDGKVLYEKSAHRKQAVASTAKILTALVVLKNSRPSDVVTASSRAQLVGDVDALVTQLNLSAGERLTVEQLLYGLLLPSANDAAVALAEHVGGSVGGFAAMMNAEAKELGAKDSNFTNPNGLDDPEQYSSAYDLALFARAAMRKPLFRQIVGTRSHSIPAGGSPGGRTLQNRNQLLGRFPGAIGIKTGQTLASGKSLVAAARRGSEERIAVVLASPDPLREAESLLTYGLTGFRRFQMAQESAKWGEITYGDGTTARLIALKDAGLLLPSSEPNPQVIFDQKKRLLSAQVGEGLKVPVKIECIPKPCRLPPERRSGILPGLLSVLAPLLALAR